MVAQGDDIPIESNGFSGRVQRPLGLNCYTAHVISEDGEEFNGRDARHNSVEIPCHHHSSTNP